MSAQTVNRNSQAHYEPVNCKREFITGERKLKKNIVLCVCLCIILTCTATIFADELPEIYGGTVECNSGETVSYPVHIANNPGMTSYLIGIGCESDWLYFDEEATLGNFSNDGSITSSSDDRRLYAMWYNVDAVSNDGTLFTVNIHVSPSTPDGEYPIILVYSSENTLDTDCNELELNTVNGCIKVKHVAYDNMKDMQENPAVAETNNRLILIICVSLGVAAMAAVVIILKNSKMK